MSKGIDSIMWRTERARAVELLPLYGDLLTALERKYIRQHFGIDMVALSSPEIADRDGKSSGTVRNIISNGMAKMKAKP